MSNKYSEMMALLDWIDHRSAKKDKPKRRRAEPDYDIRNLDMSTLIHKEIAKAEALLKLLKDYEKANKKDDKKPEGMSLANVATIFMLSFPIALLVIKAIKWMF
jgi:hypothetical protein